MSVSAFVAKELGFNLPDDYSEFLNSLGYLYLNNLGIEVYGHKAGFDIQKIPSILAATDLNKRAYQLHASEIVISHTGYEDLITVLNCNTSRVYEIGFDGFRNEIANCFGAWLIKLIQKNDSAG